MHRDNVIRASHGVTPAGAETGSLARTVYPAGIAAVRAGISGEVRQTPCTVRTASWHSNVTSRTA
jgi:hypothetical protein